MITPPNRIIVYQKYTFYLLFILKFPFITEETPKFFHLLWEGISWISVFLPLHLSVCHLKALYDGFYTDSMDVLSTNAIQGAWLICSTITMLNYKLLSQHLDGMFNEIDETFQWRSPKGKTFVTLETCYKYANYVSLFWQITPVGVVILNLLRPLFARPLTLPSVSWYFLNLDNTFNFTLAYLLQSWAQLIVVCGFAVGSSLFCSFSFLCCGQLNILRCAFKNLVYTSGIYKRFPDTLELTNVPADSVDYFFATEMDDTIVPVTKYNHTSEGSEPSVNFALTLEEIKSFREALTKCVQHHLQLQRICNLMETFFNLFAILRVFEVTAQMCFMSFVFSKTNDFMVLIYGVFAGFDLFLMTYPADHITYQNYAIGTSLMLGPWYIVGKYFRNEFLIIMMHTNRPIRFTAGKILLLNADRLRLAFTAAFSYYTLLSSFDKRH